jgi:hypothetical protein
MINKLVGYARQHHIALIALFVAMGGTSYAAATGSIDSREIKNNSVSTNDLRNNGIRSRDVRNGALVSEDFKAGELPAGPQGAQGPRGFTGARGATGATGAAFPTGNLPSGRTMKGTYAVHGTGQVFASDHISFPVQLAAAPTNVGMKRLDPSEPGNPSTTRCPGSASNPLAAPGELCIYEGTRFNAGLPELCKPDNNPGTCNNTGSGQATRWGMFLRFKGTTGNTDFGSNGTWAMTAP